MFTVVVAEQEFLDTVNEYEPYLRPLLNCPEMKLCRWNPAETELADAVPELESVVSRQNRWRLIVVCDESGLHRKNPFFAVPFERPEQGVDEPLEEYLPRLKTAKFAAFDEAVKQPLTRLMTWLCEDPLISGSRFNPEHFLTAEGAEDYIMRREKLLYNEYMDEAERKQEIRDKLRDGRKADIMLPSEILCIARRTASEDGFDIRTAWNANEESRYSSFSDWNLYYDKMRYLVFDILPKSHKSYGFDRLRFLLSLMLVAGNPMPADALQPNQVYALRCDTNEDALRTAVSYYDAKMSITQDVLRERIGDIRGRERLHFTDREAATLFCVNKPINVTIPAEADTEGMIVENVTAGLSTDCPKDEETEWSYGYELSKAGFKRYVRQPRRGVKRAAQTMLERNNVDLTKVEGLNEFQFEDICQYTNEEELEMVRTDTCDLYNLDRYFSALEDKNKEIKKMISTRMSKKTTLLLSITVIVLAILCCVPLLMTNRTTATSMNVSLIISGIFVGLTVLTAFLTLLFFRHRMKKQYLEYNGLVDSFRFEMEDSMKQYGKYLTHACNVMRGNRVINYRNFVGDPDVRQIRILNKHIDDIERSREELRAMFGGYLSQKVNVELTNNDAYSYDFNRPTDYEYLFEFRPDQEVKIEFIQPDSYIRVPVDFVRRLSVRREELYD